MSHAVVANYQVNNTSEYFQAIWKLTRTMEAAGWKYKASSDASGTSTNKDTSAVPSNDKWAVGGGVNLTQVGAQTGTNPTIGAPSAGISTITGVSGFVANSVGRFISFTGALNSANNGVFRILTQSGTSVTVFNPNAVAESGANITWQEMQGGAAATIATSGTGGATPGRCIVSGLTGMVPQQVSPLVRGSVGDILTIIGGAIANNNGSFRITRVLSTTSVEIDNPNATSVGETNNGALVWVEMSPLAQVYPATLQGSTGTGAWLVLQGPSIMKVYIGTNVPTGTFVRNELVTATTSGATGTLLGVLTDPVTGQGYAVIAPRLDGTGAGPRGWTSGSTDTITGAISGATITSVATTPLEYVKEIVFWKNTQSAGHIYVQCVDAASESAYRFSVIAANAGITNVLAPGSSAAGGFPLYGSYVMCGSGGVASASTSSTNWTMSSSLGVAGNVQIMCANAIALSTTDADGSFVFALGQPATNNGAYNALVHMRCDDTEEGDVDPYVSFSPDNGAYDGNRTGVTTQGTNDWFNNNVLGTATGTPWKGWRRRGFISAGSPNGDAFQQFQGHLWGINSTTLVQWTGISRVQHAIQEQMIKEPVWVLSTQAYQRMRKGTLRWLFVTEGNSASMSYNDGQFVQLTNSGSWPVIAGPWDGASTAINF